MPFPLSNCFCLKSESIQIFSKLIINLIGKKNSKRKEKKNHSPQPCFSSSPFKQSCSMSQICVLFMQKSLASFEQRKKSFEHVLNVGLSIYMRKKREKTVFF